MTRINTNVSSLVAQNTLGRSNSSLNQALTRLSTGLRINTGKDDPAGLIASENLRSDITSINRAISNTDRATQVIATADSALGQVSSLLNDIRGLVTESANTGALSEDQIAANQLQVDSSLEALNRIAQTTTFQGRKLLDGSLDFITQATANFDRLQSVEIDQANLGATGTAAVDVNVTAAATKAQIDVANIPAATTAVAAEGTLTFSDSQLTATGSIDINISERQSAGTLTFSTTGGTTISIDTQVGGAAAGAVGGASGGVDIDFTDTNDASGNVTAASYTAGTNTIAISADFTGGVTSGEIATAIAGINGGTAFNAAATNGATALAAGDATGGGPGGVYADVATGGAAAAVETISITAAAGAAGNISITLEESFGVTTGTPTVSGNADDGYTVSVAAGNVNTNVSAIASAIQGITEVATATGGGATVFNGSLDNVPPAVQQLTGGRDAGDDVITITATQAGSTFNRNISFVTNNTTAGGISVTDDLTTITVAIDNTSAYQLTDIADAISTQLSDYRAEVTTSNGSGIYEVDNANENTGPTSTNVAGGITSSGGLNKDAVIELGGAFGNEVFSLKAGTSITELVNQVNLVSDATGVAAQANGTTLELRSSGYGTDSVVDLKVVQEDNGDFTAAVGSGARAVGTDVIATVNGIAAKGDGNTLSINTATLDLTTTVEADYIGLIEFDITGGGALFQLGPDVVSNEQARIGVTSVNTARLGTVSGKLFELQSGGTADLTTDTTKAARIVEEAIDQVTSLRGRLGAFQRTTLETNKNALNDTLVNLTEAESSIRDADFAQESAALTRAQILVQSGTQVLSIANSNPQNVLALLR